MEAQRWSSTHICICRLAEVAQPEVDCRKVFQEPVLAKLHTVQCSPHPPKGEFKEAELSIWSKIFLIQIQRCDVCNMEYFELP